MNAAELVDRRQPSSESLPKFLPNIALRHGEVMWVLSELGFRGSATSSTFYEYIKSLRKIGIPFERGSIGFIRRGRAYYSYDHLMELALVLTLRVYYFVPDPLLVEIIKNRATLGRYYRRAYAERNRGIGKAVTVRARGFGSIRTRGVFLDLGINYSGGKLTKFGPPKPLSPFEALVAFVERDSAARAFLPINLSLLSERIVLRALQAPVLHQKSRANSKKR